MATKKDETTTTVHPNEAKKLARAARQAKMVIKLKTNGFNPKQKGSKSAARFDLYRDGMTVLEYVEAGGYSADIPWDTQREFIEITESK